MNTLCRDLRFDLFGEVSVNLPSTPQFSNQLRTQISFVAVNKENGVIVVTDLPPTDEQMPLQRFLVAAVHIYIALYFELATSQCV